MPRRRPLVQERHARPASGGRLTRRFLPPAPDNRPAFRMRQQNLANEPVRLRFGAIAPSQEAPRRLARIQTLSFGLSPKKKRTVIGYSGLINPKLILRETSIWRLPAMCGHIRPPHGARVMYFLP